MFSQKSNSFIASAKQRKNGEQPNQTKRPLNPVFSKKRPLAELQQYEFEFDFPKHKTNEQLIFENSKKMESTSQFTKPILSTPKPSQLVIVKETTQITPPTETAEPKRLDQTIRLDENSQGIKPPSLEEYSRSKNLERVGQEQEISSRQILDSLILSGNDELSTQLIPWFHLNMLQKISLTLQNEFQACSKVIFLQNNLIFAVKDQLILIYNQNGILYQKQIQWPIEHAFFYQDVLYISSTEELICLKFSESAHLGLKVDSEQAIGVTTEKVIHTSAIVKGKIWVGMSQAQELTVEKGKQNYFSCKAKEDLKVKLPRKSLVGQLTSFFSSKNKVTQMYDLPEIDLAVALLQNASKYQDSEVQFFCRDSLKMGGSFSVQWLSSQIHSFINQNDRSKHRLYQLDQTEIINISGRFFSLQQQRHLVITLKNGVSVNLYIAPSRNQKSAASITEDDISVFSIDPSPVEGCLAQIDFLNSMLAPKYNPPLLSRRYELNMQPPFKIDLSIAQYEILSFKRQKNLEVFVVLQEERLFIISSIRQRSQTIYCVTPILGTIYYDLAVEDFNHHTVIKIITEQGVQVLQQKTLRDHIGSYVQLATMVEGGLTQARNLYSDFEELLAQYPQDEILAILVDFTVCDQVSGQPIHHDIAVQNFYLNQTSPQKLQVIKVNQRIKEESFRLFEALIRRMRDEQDKKKWDLCCGVVHNVLRLKCESILFTYPFRVGTDSISPELLKESQVNFENMSQFLITLKSEQTAQFIHFCVKMREVCQFLQIVLMRTNYDLSVILSTLFDEDRKMIEQIQFQDLVALGLESEGLQIFIENYLTNQKHDPNVLKELYSQCCNQFINQDFLELSLARQRLMRSDSSRDQVHRAIQSLCLHVNKTDLLATFDLLMENFENYGLNPSITYLQYYIETKFVHLQWCQANIREIESTNKIQETRFLAMDLLLEMVEEFGLRIKSRSKDHPKSENSTINQLRTKLEKSKKLEEISQSLRYLVLRIQQIDDSSLHKNLFALLQKLDLPQYIRESNSKHLIQYFKDKVGSVEETPQSIQITADNLILLDRFKDCFTHVVDQIGSSRNFCAVLRPTFLKLALETRILLLQKAQLCLDRMEKSSERQRWQSEVSLFGRLLQIQSEIKDLLTKVKNREISEEGQFQLSQLQSQVYSPDELVDICQQNSFYSEMLQAIMLKVDRIGLPLSGYKLSDIELQVQNCYSSLVKSEGVDETAQKLEILFQIQESQVQRQRETNLVDLLHRQQLIDLFPLDRILAFVFNQNKCSDTLMRILYNKFSLCDLVEICIRSATLRNNSLIALAPVLRSLVTEKAQVKSIAEKNLLQQLRNLIVCDYIEQEIRHSRQIIDKAKQLICDIDQLTSS